MTSNVELYDLSDHPKFAKTVGELFAVWTVIEYRLSHLYSLLLRSPPWIASAAYFAVVNNRARLDMLRAIIARMQPTNPDRKPLLELIEAIKDAPAARHGYAHKPWLRYQGNVYQMDEDAPQLDQCKKHRVKLNQIKDDVVGLRKLDARLVHAITDYSIRHPMQITATEDDLPWLRKFPIRNPNQGP